MDVAMGGKETPAPATSQMKLIPQLVLPQTPKNSQHVRKSRSCQTRLQLWGRAGLGWQPSSGSAGLPRHSRMRISSTGKWVFMSRRMQTARKLFLHTV